jgi:hypothetical protein
MRRRTGRTWAERRGGNGIEAAGLNVSTASNNHRRPSLDGCNAHEHAEPESLASHRQSVVIPANQWRPPIKAVLFVFQASVEPKIAVCNHAMVASARFDCEIAEFRVVRDEGMNACAHAAELPPRIQWGEGPTANSCASMSWNDLNSRALPLGSRKNIVDCSPVCPLNRV